MKTLLLHVVPRGLVASVAQKVRSRTVVFLGQTSSLSMHHQNTSQSDRPSFGVELSNCMEYPNRIAYTLCWLSFGSVLSSVFCFCVSGNSWNRINWPSYWNLFHFVIHLANSYVGFQVVRCCWITQGAVRACGRPSFTGRPSLAVLGLALLAFNRASNLQSRQVLSLTILQPPKAMSRPLRHKQCALFRR